MVLTCFPLPLALFSVIQGLYCKGGLEALFLHVCMAIQPVQQNTVADAYVGA